MQHAASLNALHVGFPYERCVLLVAEWPTFLAELASESAAIRGELVPIGLTRITECLAGWDGVLLLSEAGVCPLLSATLGSRLAPRLGLALLSEVGEARWRRELERVAAAAVALPPARRDLPAWVRRGVDRLPLRWQPPVHQYLRARGTWTVKRLVAACQVDRRTLERGFRRAGLPSPAAVLRD